MNKKKYEQPQFNVIELKATDIICYSNQTGTFSLYGTEYTEEPWSKQ